MNFFDPKEEVIDLKLTQYGKHLLSKGKLIPKYYAFFDDDIIYDIKWASDSLSERQSDVADRVQDETPRPRVQSCFHGIETEIKKINELIRQKKAKLGDDILQPTPSKHHAMALPLGNSSLSSNKMPAWQTYFLKGELDSKVDYVTGSSPNIKIPQLDCKIEFKGRAVGETEEINMTPGEQAAINNEGADGDWVGAWGGELEFDDGTRLLIEKDYLLLEIEESNTDYLDENYDIEVYEIKTIPASGSAQLGTGKGEIEELIPLYFARQTSDDLGSVYLTSAPEGSAQSATTMFPDVDPSYVEYFFDINVDREIDRAVICENLPDDKARSARLQKDFRCPDDIPMGSLLDAAAGLYDSEMRDLDDFEDCD